MKNVRPYLLVAVLFISAIWILFAKENKLAEINRGNEDKDLKAQALMEKVPEVRMIPLPIVVKEAKEVVPPKSSEVKKEVPDKKPAKEEAQKDSSDKDAHAGNGKEKGESAPNLVAGYEMPVEDYLGYMRSKGSKVLVYSKSMDRIICEILEDGSFTVPSGMKRMSRRSRRITDDFPHSKTVFNKVEERFGPGSYEILLLLPVRLEESIYVDITRITEEKGLKMRDIATVFMIYRGDTSSVSVYIEKVIGIFGTREIGETFRL